MKQGDFVRYLDKMWLVGKHDPKLTKTAYLVDFNGATTEVPHDLDGTGGVVVLCNPSQDWPVLTLPEKPTLKKLLCFRRQVQARVFDLNLGEDWIPAEASRSGGSIFFNPALRLRYGDQLLAVYEKGSRRVLIPQTFNTFRAKTARTAAAQAEVELLKEKNAFTKLLEGPQIGDDDA